MPTTYEIAGQTVTMPCVVRDASVGTAMFDVDATRAQALIPDDFVIVETSPGRAQLIVAVIDYRDNDLGDYDEVGITFFAKPRGTGDDQAGTFIARLPVNQEFSCEAGRTIWGFPKSVADIAIDYADRSVSCTLRMEGELVLRLTLPRGGDDEMPPMPMATYTIIDGAPHRTTFTQAGTRAQVLVGGGGVTLVLGDHPMAKELVELGIGAEAQISTWIEHMQGTFEAATRL